MHEQVSSKDIVCDSTIFKQITEERKDLQLGKGCVIVNLIWGRIVMYQRIRTLSLDYSMATANVVFKRNERSRV